MLEEYIKCVSEQFNHDDFSMNKTVEGKWQMVLSKKKRKRGSAKM